MSPLACSQAVRTSSGPSMITVSELSRFGKFHDVYIIQRMREFGAHFLGAVYQCNARLLDTEMAASADGIPDHFNPLLQRGAWNHCGIGEEQQFMVSRNLHHCQVSEDFPFRGASPFSLSRMACSRLSVLMIPFIKISAPPSRAMRTASRAASSESSM